MILSVIIPSYKDPLLFKTIRSLLDNSELGNQLEIIAVFDGYYPPSDLIIEDPRVKYVHLGKNRGMRGAINAGMNIAKGEFVARLDEHCSFAKGFDKILTETCEPNWIVTPTRYFLDPIKWKRMNLPPVNFAKLVIKGGKFTAENWKERDEEMKDIMIAETMGMQGSFWVMPRKLWEDVIGELQTEGYGALYGDSHEVIFKIWKIGGKCMLNKNTWYAHKHRKFPRTHSDGTSENPANKIEGWAYSINIWGNYFQNEIRPKWKI